MSSELHDPPGRRDGTAHLSERAARVSAPVFIAKHSSPAAEAATDDVRVLIVADNASEKYGGEAVLPLRYFEALRARGVPVWLITHARVRAELTARMPEALDHIHFIEDSWIHRLLWRIGQPLDHRLSYVSTQFLSRLLTQSAQRRLAKSLTQSESIDVVHQPTPVSPREPSILTGLGAPVVFGPMNGGTDFPPAFRNQESRITRALLPAVRALAPAVSWLLAGKRDAAVLLIANERSRAVLFEAADGKVFSLPENGVDTKLWRPQPHLRRPHPTCRFAFVGSLIRSKGVDLWIEAFQRAVGQGLEVSGIAIGDGRDRQSLIEHARSAGVLANTLHEPGKIYFAGWKTQVEVRDLLAEQDCLVFPTLCECGGAVLLEAMAMELPVIATDWGGPAEYVDPECGILVHPHSHESFVAGLTEAMQQMTADPEMRARMGKAGRRKVELSYTWDGKIESVLGFYRKAARQHRLRPDACRI